MNKIRIIGVLLAAVLTATSFTACGKPEQNTSEQTNSTVSAEPQEKTETAEQIDIYRFEDYESDEVFDIKRLELKDEYEQKCVSYKFNYLSDGYKIKAYISIPLKNIESQKPQQCIMYNRGGNSELGLLEDDTVASLCSMLGYTVIASQYRGAGGREGKDQFGGDDLNDVTKLIDLCENNFSFIDMNDFCVACASRGGVMTYPLARRDSRVRRIIAVSAISDLISGYEEREDMRDLLAEYIGCTPEENPEEYKKRSAIYWADEITIPVLIIHSTGDQQVSYHQAQELYEKLSEHGNCTFFTHEDDVHGIHPEDFQNIIEWLRNT